MFEYPLPQTIIITLLDCLMIVYLFIKRPFESTFDSVQQPFFEFVGLGVMISVFINTIFDAGKYQILQGRNNVGKFVIVCNMMFNFVTAIFMLIIIVQSLREFYKEQKQKRTVLKTKNRLQNPSSLDMSQIHLKKEKTTDQSLMIQEESMTSQNFEEISLQQEGFAIIPLNQSRRCIGEIGPLILLSNQNLTEICTQTILSIKILLIIK